MGSETVSAGQCGQEDPGTIPLLEAASAVVMGVAQWFPWAVQIEGWPERKIGHERR